MTSNLKTKTISKKSFKNSVWTSASRRGSQAKRMPVSRTSKWKMAKLNLRGVSQYFISEREMATKKMKGSKNQIMKMIRRVRIVRWIPMTQTITKIKRECSGQGSPTTELNVIRLMINQGLKPDSNQSSNQI